MLLAGLRFVFRRAVWIVVLLLLARVWWWRRRRCRDRQVALPADDGGPAAVSAGDTIMVVVPMTDLGDATLETAVSALQCAANPHRVAVTLALSETLDAEAVWGMFVRQTQAAELARSHLDRVYIVQSPGTDPGPLVFQAVAYQPAPVAPQRLLLLTAGATLVPKWDEAAVSQLQAAGAQGIPRPVMTAFLPRFPRLYLQEVLSQSPPAIRGPTPDGSGPPQYWGAYETSRSTSATHWTSAPTVALDLCLCDAAVWDAAFHKQQLGPGPRRPAAHGSVSPRAPMDTAPGQHAVRHRWLTERAGATLLQPNAHLAYALTQGQPGKGADVVGLGRS